MTRESAPPISNPTRAGKRNVIILTSGITGSSVLAGFLARSGYWVGDRTHKKEYDTFENQELIDLNREIFRQSGYTNNYVYESSTEVLRRIESLYGKIDASPFLSFIEKCDGHRPWIWKDPRLWLTFRYWKHLVNPEECQFILLTRDLRQAWLSIILRRQIMSYRVFRKQEEHVIKSILGILNDNGLQHLHVRYDDLIAKPDSTIERLNQYLDAKLTIDDLKTVYTKPLHRSPRVSVLNSLKAILIYFKNYSKRSDPSVENARHA
jgi:hypothetical protein